MSDGRRERAQAIVERSRDRSRQDEVQRHLDAVKDSLCETTRLVAVRKARIEGYEAGFRDGRRSRRWWR